jgi:hypothetical protein
LNSPVSSDFKLADVVSSEDKAASWFFQLQIWAIRSTVGWVERSDTHHLSMRAVQDDGFRKGSTHPTGWEKMSRMQWYRISFSCAAGATGAQNLSTAV